MFLNYLIVALRGIYRQKFNTLLNVLGLSLGLTCSLLIIFHVREELSWDRYYPHGDQIYRITTENLKDGNHDWAVVSPLHGLAMVIAGLGLFGLSAYFAHKRDGHQKGPGGFNHAGDRPPLTPFPRLDCTDSIDCMASGLLVLR